MVRGRLLSRPSGSTSGCAVVDDEFGGNGTAIPCVCTQMGLDLIICREMGLDLIIRANMIGNGKYVPVTKGNL